MKQLLRYRKTIIVLIAILTAILCDIYLPFEEKTNRGLALLALVAILWLTEAVHITITAILIPVAAILLGLETTKSSLITFADPTIFLFFGGFVIATALSVQKLDKYIAHKLISLANGRFNIAIILIFIVTALLSMGISNTATAAMMIPLGIGLLKELDFQTNKNTYAFVVLGIAFSANIGGMGTLVGSPPNAIVAAQIHLTFLDWLKYGTPIMIILMPIMIFVMFIILRPKLNLRVETEQQTEKLIYKQKLTIFIFIITSLLWITGSWLNPILSDFLKIERIGAFDSIVALSAAIFICGLNIASWKEIEKNTDWGVLLLFGGGLTLSAVLIDSGAGNAMVQGVLYIIEGQSTFIIALMVAFLIVFLTGFTSNTASAALLVPIFIPISEALGINPLGISLIIGLGASCAFILPVSTPPNAIAYGTGYVEQKIMVKVGFILSLLSILFIATMAYFLWF